MTEQARQLEPAGPRDYVAIARIDHWFKNVFMLPGAALAYVLAPVPPGIEAVGDLFVGVLATCLIASANYTINEWLDAAFDRYHPTKRNRPAALRAMSPALVWLQWLVLAGLGLALGATLGLQFQVFAATLLVMGLLYNVEPFRTKDRVYLDVLTESINNPLRFMLGWTAIVSDVLPPSSVLIAYWMGGAFLMAVKRYAEYRFIGDPGKAGLYRESFKHYSEDKLLLSAFFYALSSSLFLGIFLIKYRVEFLILFPFLAALFVWYLYIGLRADSVAQRPEKLYTERRFVAFVVFLGVLTAILFFVDIPWMSVLVDHHVLGR